MNATSSLTAVPRRSLLQRNTLGVTLRAALEPRGFLRRGMFASRPLSWIPTSVRRHWLSLAAAGALVCVGFADRAAAEPMDSWSPVALPANAIKDPNDLIFANGKFT